MGAQCCKGSDDGLPPIPAHSSALIISSSVGNQIFRDPKASVDLGSGSQTSEPITPPGSGYLDWLETHQVILQRCSDESTCAHPHVSEDSGYVSLDSGCTAPSVPAKSPALEIENSVAVGTGECARPAPEVGFCDLCYDYFDLSVLIMENGKVCCASCLGLDQEPCANPDQSIPASAPVESSVSAVVAQCWMEVLGRSPCVNFFADGGNSQGAVRLVEMIRDKIGVLVSVMDVFEHPTHQQLTEYLEPLTRPAALIEKLPADEAPVCSDSDELKVVIECCSQVTGLELCSTDNFFEHGCNSMKAVQLVALLTNRVAVPLSVIDLYNFPTADELATYISLC